MIYIERDLVVTGNRDGTFQIEFEKGSLHAGTCLDPRLESVRKAVNELGLRKIASPRQSFRGPTQRIRTLSHTPPCSATCYPGFPLTKPHQNPPLWGSI